MRGKRTARFAATLSASIAGIALQGAAAAQAAEVRAGAVLLSYDASRWRAETTATVTMFHPVGAGQQTSAPVRLTIVPAGEGGQECSALATALLPGDLYVEAEISATTMGGRPAQKISARTRCRNATQKGTVLCLMERSTAHLLSTTITSCREAEHPFTGTQGIDELAAGMRPTP